MTARKGRQEMNLHFIGIGGIGMSGIAQVFQNQGYRVSGSDIADSDTSRKLAQMGIEVQLGHRADNVRDADVVVVSSAVKPDNPEVIEARRRRLPVIPRAEMLGELMRGKMGIAIAGTHGKTTTTSMMATVLTAAGWDPTMVIGGKVDSLGGNAKLGQGNYVVAEADESDGSFLHLPATYAALTNIDNDHLDHYGSLKAIDDAFVEFVGQLPFYGLAAICAEDPGARRILTRLTKPFVTYGFSEEWDYSATAVRTESLASSFTVRSRREGVLGEILLHVPGRHNVLNALAVVALCLDLGMPFATIASGLSQYRGVKRRFEIRWRDDSRNRMIVDDYGHHPTEIEATLAAARQFWRGRVVAVFQPHRFSRTLHCRDGFLRAFHGADVVLLTDIYAAGEAPIEGVTSESLVEEMRRVALPGQQILHVGGLESARDLVSRISKDGDLVLCLGAGTITRLPELLIQSIQGA
jgi:UDP-N-acetylmuramate--alanine ligase